MQSRQAKKSSSAYKSFLLEIININIYNILQIMKGLIIEFFFFCPSTFQTLSNGNILLFNLTCALKRAKLLEIKTYFSQKISEIEYKYPMLLSIISKTNFEMKAWGLWRQYGIWSSYIYINICLGTDEVILLSRNICY